MSPIQFSPFVREITNACQAVWNSSCPKSPLKGKTQKNFNQPKHRSFSVFPTHAREVWKRGTWHAAQRSVATCTEYSERTSHWTDRLSEKRIRPCLQANSVIHRPAAPEFLSSFENFSVKFHKKSVTFSRFQREACSQSYAIKSECFEC